MSSASLDPRYAVPGTCILFLSLALVTHLDQFLGPFGFVDFYDTIEVHFSHFMRMSQLLIEYGPFSWYPFHGGGVPAFVGQHPPYHPAVLLSVIFPVWLLSLCWNVAQMALAGWGMCRLLQQLVGVSREVSLLLGTLFALAFINGNVHIVFSYAFPAFAVLTMEAFDPRLGRAARIGRCIGIVLISMFSFPVLTLPHYPIFHLALILLLGRNHGDYKRHIAGVFLVWTGYVLLFAPSVVSLYLYIPFAQRDWNFSEVSAGKAIVSFLLAFKGRFIELSVFPLLLPSIYLLRRDRRAHVVFLMILIPLIIACVFGSDMKSFLANTFLVKMDLFLSSMLAGCSSFILVALAMDALRKSSGYAWSYFLLSFGFSLLRRVEYNVVNGLLVVLAAFAALELIKLAEGLRLQNRMALFLSLLVIALAGHGIMTRQQYMSAGSYFPYRPFIEQKALTAIASEAKSEPFRVGCIDIHPAVVQAYGLDTVGGKSPLFNRYYKEFVQTIVAPQLSSTELREGFGSVWRQLYLTRSNVDHDQRPLVLSGPDRSAHEFDVSLLEAMGVRYLISARPLHGFEDLADLVASGAGEDSSLPAFLRNTEIGRMYALQSWVYRLRNANHLGYLAIQNNTTAGVSALPSDPQRSVKLVSWAPDRLIFEGTTTGPTTLVVSNNFDPRWSATLNAQQTSVSRTNHAFQAIRIEQPGPFRAVFDFHAPLIWWLHLVSLLGIMSIFSCVAISRGTSASPGLSAQMPRLLPMRPLYPWRNILTGGLISLVWGAGFYLFVLRKVQAGTSHSVTMTYALWSIPLLGPCIGGWTAWFARSILSGSFCSKRA